jgi:hypothetical protein
MKNFPASLIPITAFMTISLTISCKTRPGSDSRYPGREDVLYELRLSPSPGSEYHYDITNQTEYKLQVGEKKVDNLNRSVAGIEYSVNKDSAGNFLFNVGYDKIHLYSKNDDIETDLDADSAAVSVNPSEKMLGVLKQTKFGTVMSPKGDQRSATGYDDLKAKVMTAFGPGDAYSKKVAETQWDKQVRDGLLKKNMDQFFKVFPDSGVHVGDQWEINSVQQDQINIHVHTQYKLRKIEDGIASISLEGTMLSDSSVGNMSGYDFTADFKGKQEGELELEAKTGMLVSSNIAGEMEGTLTVMGRQVPVNIHTSMKAKGRKIK